MTSSTTLQNRVDPWGQLHAVASRGTRMGNRGILHDESNRIVRPWAHKSWVSCLLTFKDIKRPKPFSQGNYSELFFLDEATAFAAGHRPCAFCQKARHQAFKKAWVEANLPEDQRARALMPALDRVLHAERSIPGGAKRTYDAPLAELPAGAMFEHGGHAWLVSPRGFLPWSFEGYGAPAGIDGHCLVRVLTPQSMVRAFAGGFPVETHSSATGA